MVEMVRWTMQRYLRPIYEAIDTRQYKTALKLCAHKKVASYPLVQVLKAHCLERTGRPEEALSLCRSVRSQKPTDETLLQTMALVFRLCGQEEEMLPAYEYAVSVQPTEELLQALFAAYGKRGDWLKQQQTATKLFRSYQKRKYVCWACTSMLIQVRHGQTPPKMLQLAERMLLPVLQEDPAADGNALQLLMQVMEAQGKYGEALSVFDELVEKKDVKARALEGQGAPEDEIETGAMDKRDRYRLETELSKNAGEWSRCRDVQKKWLEVDGDDWDAYTQLMEAEEELLGKEAGTRVVPFLEEMADKMGTTLRGPHLAKVHWWYRVVNCTTYEPKVEAEATLVEALVAYMRQFYRKTCCFTDIQQYLLLFIDDGSVSDSSKQQLLQGITRVEQDLGTPREDTPTGENALNAKLLVLKIRRFLQGSIDPTDVGFTNPRTFASTLLREQQTLAYVDDGGQSQKEVRKTDDLLLLCAHYLLDDYQQTPSRVLTLLECLTVLEHALGRSESNFQARLLLSQIYASLGHGRALVDCHTKLDVKHIQLDSLSYLVFDKLQQLACVDDVQSLCRRIDHLHRTSSVETLDLIQKAYRLGEYAKVLDLTKFKYKRMDPSQTRVLSSLHLVQTQVEEAVGNGASSLAGVLSSNPRIDGLEDLDARRLSRNEDRALLVSWRRASMSCSDFFSLPQAPLVSLDRSLDIESSRKWMALQTTAIEVLRHMGQTDAGAMETSVGRYQDLVQDLVQGSSDAHSMWHASALALEVVASVVLAVTKDHDQMDDRWTRVEDEMKTLLTSMGDHVVFSDGHTTLVSAAGVSAIATYLHEAGMWMLSALTLALRLALKKKKKKEASGIKSLLRTLQTETSNLQMKVKEQLLAVHVDVEGMEEGWRSLESAHEVKRNLEDAARELATRLDKQLEERVKALRLACAQK